MKQIRKLQPWRPWKLFYVIELYFDIMDVDWKAAELFHPFCSLKLNLKQSGMSDI